MLQSHSDTHMHCWAITSSTEERLLYFLLFAGSFFSSCSTTLDFKSHGLPVFHILAKDGVLPHFGVQFYLISLFSDENSAMELYINN